jgi:hypothetical protein
MTLGILACTVLGFYNFSYFVRPDSFLLLNSVLAIVAAEFVTKRILVYLAIGLLAGLSFNCKINAPMYFLPIAAFYLEKEKGRWSTLAFLAALVAFGAGVVFPFLLPKVSASAFWEWINLPWVSSGLRYPMFEGIKDVTYGLAFLAVLWLVGVWPRYKWTFGVLAFVSIVAGFIPRLLEPGCTCTCRSCRFIFGSRRTATQI